MKKKEMSTENGGKTKDETKTPLQNTKKEKYRKQAKKKKQAKLNQKHSKKKGGQKIREANE